MPWEKGQSGNPGGRAKLRGEALDVKLMAKKHSRRALARLVELIESEDPRVAVIACREILDRAFGKPTQSIEAQVEHSSADPLTDLRRRLGALPAAVGAGGLATGEEPS